MLFDGRWLVMTLVNLLAVHAFGMANDALTPHSVYLVLEGALLVLPAFYLGIWGSAGCAIITALFWEAGHPAAGTGSAVSVFLLFNLMIWLNRNRFQREHPLQLVAVTLMVNGIWILYLAMAYAAPGATYWGRVFLDGLLSQFVVVGVVYWLHLVQRSMLRLFRMSLHTEGYSP